ncbi:hypothetical protein TNCV_772321 [Trichonephila clavipes]|nr:hypothetical protein TNCV_772321 [Trichonephila clavipes]
MLVSETWSRIDWPPGEFPVCSRATGTEPVCSSIIVDSRTRGLPCGEQGAERSGEVEVAPQAWLGRTSASLSSCKSMEKASLVLALLVEGSLLWSFPQVDPQALH